MSVFIPKNIRVGFQNREDTFTKKLAYVIYFGPDGKIRKECSWKNWRDDKIEPVDYANEPTSGFMLNKGITRYNWSDFGHNRRTMVRIYDPRGIEFEITAENLVGVLMHTDCSRREITGELVYAWNRRGELMLLPCTSEEYVEASRYTALQGKKFSAKDLKEGCTYTTKAGKPVIYLGRFDHYKWKGVWGDHVQRERIKKKEHIFAQELVNAQGTWRLPKDKTHAFIAMSPSSRLAETLSEDVVEGFASIVDSWLKQPQAQPIKRFMTEPSTDAECHGNSGYTVDGDGFAVHWHYTGRGYSYWHGGSSRIGWHANTLTTADRVCKHSGFSEATPEGLGKLIAVYENKIKKEFSTW